MQCVRHCCVWGAAQDRADLVAPTLRPGVLGRRASQGPQGESWWGQGSEDDWVSTHQVHPSGQVIRKGVLPDIDSYSAFFDNSKLSKTALEEIIKKELVSDIYVCGIATDVCVGKKCLCDTENVPPVRFFTLAIYKMHEILLEDMKRPRLKAT